MSDLANGKVELILENLSCANCASKIEQKVNSLYFVKNANLNFVTKKLTAEVSPKDYKLFLENVTKIVNEIEPDVKVLEVPKEKPVIDIKDLSLIIVSIFFFASGLFVYKRAWWGLIFLAAAYILAGESVIRKFLQNLLRLKLFDENFLMTVATISAFLLKEYPEAVLVMLLYKIGELLEETAIRRSRKTINSLKNLEIEYANLKIENEIKRVNPKDIVPGDTVIVKAGERVPIDGVVAAGSSFLDTSAITGESRLIPVKENDEVFAGLINIDGTIEVLAKSFYKDSTISKIIEIVENATSKKSQTERFITYFARVYTPAVTVIAFLVAVVPPLLFSQPFDRWIYRALIFLIVSCPCSLVLSVPLSYFAGVARLSKASILVKGTTYIDKMARKIYAILFDKTGTITQGSLKVDKVVTKDISYEEFIRLLCHIESFSNHPIALSVTREFKVKVEAESVKEVKEYAGKGIEGVVDGKKVIAGTKEFLEENGVKVEIKEDFIASTAVYVAVDNKFCGYVVLKDFLRQDIKDTLNLLKKLGIKTFLLTGDKKEAAEELAGELEFDGIFANLLPQDKAKIAEQIKKEAENATVVFVGDGINDCPALAVCDVGISFVQNASSIATAAADVILLENSTEKILDLIQISRFVRRVVIQNISISLSVKFLVMALGAIGFANLWEAVLADVGVALIAILNSLRILKNQK
ncbi:heavy metal translocating P-type ATPase [Caldicellulosiruptor naganoensis]|uniref:Cd(2+)-exporting ATPase n=1 Tax=Caldicellulosiruptor naganoensis TaxID=29324 RepID=A0ABY7BHW8_9FIRM|nr:heavy metal translocating P-type ATPase [Caldicellulosiruptor naganoensis]WAM31457.1 heavy metal translocating P-type ATPase [Caldicellulosiruptor naganoensis]